MRSISHQAIVLRLVTLLLLLGAPPPSLAQSGTGLQSSPEWRLAPLAGYDFESNGLYLGLQADRTKTNTWLPDRLEHEIGLLLGEDSRAVLLYLENQWAVMRSGTVPVVLVGGGYGFAFGESFRSFRGLGGFSLTIEHSLHDDAQAFVSGRYVHVGPSSKDIIPVVVGISFRL